MKNPLRFWRTGTVAVVLAALGGPGFADDAIAFGDGTLQCLSSPWGVDETVHRIEASARHRGLQVFGCFEPRGGGMSLARNGVPSDGPCVVVLESMQGGTPVLMAADEIAAGDSQVFELPLSIRVRPGDDGGAEVWVEATQRADSPQGLGRDLLVLGEVVRDALRA